jgi:hypothetical protein
MLIVLLSELHLRESRVGNSVPSFRKPVPMLYYDAYVAYDVPVRIAHCKSCHENDESSAPPGPSIQIQIGGSMMWNGTAARRARSVLLHRLALIQLVAAISEQLAPRFVIAWILRSRRLGAHRVIGTADLAVMPLRARWGRRRRWWLVDKGGAVRRHPADVVRSLVLLGLLRCPTNPEADGRAGEITRQGGMRAVLDATANDDTAALTSELAKRCESGFGERRELGGSWLIAASTLRSSSGSRRLPFASRRRGQARPGREMIADNIPGAALTIVDGAPHINPFEFSGAYLDPVVAFLQENLH